MSQLREALCLQRSIHFSVTYQSVNASCRVPFWTNQAVKKSFLLQTVQGPNITVSSIIVTLTSYIQLKLLQTDETNLHQFVEMLTRYMF